MNTVLIVIASLVFLSIIGLFIEISLRFDVSKNKGKLIIRLFKIPIFNLNLKIEGNILSLSGKKKSKKSIQVVINKKNIDFVKLLKKNIAHRIYINNLEIDCFLILDNPANVVLISSAICVLLNAVKFKLQNFQPDANISTNVLTGFNDTEVLILLDLGLAISIIDLVWALAKTFFERKELYGKKHRKFDH